jgi:hypothetical protein
VHRRTTEEVRLKQEVPENSNNVSSLREGRIDGGLNVPGELMAGENYNVKHLD